MVLSHRITAPVAFASWAHGNNAATRGVGTIKHEQRFFSLDFSLMPFFGIMLTASL
jgi:hypothetical protein